jgi:hypothetical protein
MEVKMTLAQVVYKMSTDDEFASELFSNPEDTLEERGLEISKEELAFLLSTRSRHELDLGIVSMAAGPAYQWR